MKKTNEKQEQNQEMKGVNALLEALQQASGIAAEKAAKEVMSGVTDTVAELLEVVQAEVASLQEQVKAVQAPILTVQLPDLKQIKLSKPASKLLPDALKILLSGEALMIKGPAGSGKTVLAKQVSEVLEAKFFRIVLSPDMGVSSLFGKQTAQGFVDSPLVLAVKHAMAGKPAVLLCDEYDVGSPECLVALNALFEKAGSVFFNPVTGEELTVSDKLFRIACVNTFGRGGSNVYARNRLDGSTLDRFTLMIADYCEELEKAIALNFTQDLSLLKRLQKARKKLAELGSDEIISSRTIERMHALVYGAGFSEEQALSMLTVPWSEGLAEDAGLAG